METCSRATRCAAACSPSLKQGNHQHAQMRELHPSLHIGARAILRVPTGTQPMRPWRGLWRLLLQGERKAALLPVVQAAVQKAA